MPPYPSTPFYQHELADRLHLLFTILSAADLKLTRGLNLPTIEVEGRTLLKRLTLIISVGTIKRVFYPVFPSSESTLAVLAEAECPLAEINSFKV